MSNTIPGGVGARAALACVAAAIPAADRSAHFALVQRLFHRAVREQLELPNGYAFRFAAETFGEVARFMENERRCCPFLTFTIELAPDDVDLYVARGAAYEELGDLNAAKADYHKALEVDPDSEDAREGISRLGGEPLLGGNR